MFAVCHTVLTASRPPENSMLRGVDPAAQFVELRAATLLQRRHSTTIADRLGHGDRREHVGGDLRYPSPLKYWMLIP